MIYIATGARGDRIIAGEHLADWILSFEVGAVEALVVTVPDDALRAIAQRVIEAQPSPDTGFVCRGSGEPDA